MLRTVLVAALAATVPALAWALPNEIAQEGLLLDANGIPLDGQHDLRIRLYPDAVGGVAVFDETHAGVELFEGYYFVAIGSVRALGAAVLNRPTLHMGVSIDGGAELLPRVPLRKVPGAFVADIALNVTGDITPRSVAIPGVGPVIDAQGRWVGDPTGLQGPAGAQGPVGPAGPAGGNADPAAVVPLVVNEFQANPALLPYLRRNVNEATTGQLRFNSAAGGADLLHMANNDIVAVNEFHFAEPGPDGAFIWDTTGARIYVSPLDNSNADGYLRLINDGGISLESDTRVAGNATVTGSAGVSGNLTADGTATFNGLVRVNGGPVYVGAGRALSRAGADLLINQGTDATRVRVQSDVAVDKSLQVALDATVDRNLSVRGQITPSYGNGGLVWPDQGGGDVAWMQYQTVGGDARALRIGINNDADDRIELYSPGQVHLTGPGGNTLGFEFPNDRWGGSGDDAWIRYLSRGGENTLLQIGITNDPADQIELYSNAMVRLAGPNDAPIGLEFQTNRWGGDGETAYIRYSSEGGTNTQLEIGIANDGDDNIVLRAPGGVTIDGNLTVTGAVNLAQSSVFNQEVIARAGVAVREGQALRFWVDSNNSDSVHMRNVYEAGDRTNLRLYLHDNPDDRFSIWGDSCAGGGCNDDARARENHIFYANGNTRHAGSVTTGGDVNVGGASTINGNLTVNGTPTFNGFSFNFRGADFNIAYGPRGDGGRAFVHDGGDTLAINYAGDFAGGVRIDGNTTVGGTLRASRIYGDCPNDSRERYGICIWHIGGYDKTYREAADLCQDEGAHICSLDEITAAWGSGYQVCSCAWTSTSTGPNYDNGNLRFYSVYPMQAGGSGGCGGAVPGIRQCGVDRSDGAITSWNTRGWAVNCCK